MVPRLLERYRKQIIPEMKQIMGYKSPMQVPRLEKIVVSMGIGSAVTDIKVVEKSVDELALITGQRPVLCRAKKAISNFKIKKGQVVGCKVTLRRAHMYEFFDRLISVALPRIRDFRGFPDTSFDGEGGYSLGVTEQTIFPEIEMDKVTRVQGMNITIVTNAKTKKEAQELLKLFGFPFKG
ncbi:MAG: 50S ribosomal protein L5 [Candidatus Omnitrophica bacterium]|nr:50S ribosomal protein L5 [Candidatus Omnitrophota bacterium]MDD5352213.1 50S ribosomal protein L5 [Candidatus Omnitrophota bacterium]MDD5549811.1 50S ribosomal protein L5 [Candidatus Omnitrophota bacterium]